MSELREMIKEVNKYVDLVVERQDDAREYCRIYILEVEKLKRVVNLFIDRNAKDFQVWADKSVEVFDMSDRNIFLKIKRTVLMEYVNHYLNKISKNLAYAGILRYNLENVEIRLQQFDKILMFPRRT